MSARLNDLTGRVFERLTVIRDEGQTPSGRRKWLCRCICGQDHWSDGRDLVGGKVRSCGCLRRERMAAVGSANWAHNHRHIKRPRP